MSYETEFMKEFEEWIKTQVMINEMALEERVRRFLMKIRMSELKSL